MNRRAKRDLAFFAAVLLVLTAAVPAVGLAADEVSAPLLVDNGGLPKTAGVLLAENGLDAAHGKWGAVTADGDALGAGQIVATGQVLASRTVEGGTLESRSVVVVGDVTGTGMAGINQVVRLARALSGIDPLSGIWLEAGDINRSGAIDITDLVMACEEMRFLTSDNGSVDRTVIPFRAPDGLQEEIGIDEINVVFLNGRTDVPYIPTSQAVTILDSVLTALTEGELTCTEYCDGLISVWQRENGSSVEINYATGDMLFTDMSLWALAAGETSVVDVVNFTGPDSPLKRTEIFNRAGAPVLRNFLDYNIPLASEPGSGFLPLATFSDLCLSPAQCPLAYNGEACYLAPSGSLGDLEDEYYSVPPRERSVDLARMTYRELCFAMDLFYGLKEVHHIESFNAYFDTTGLGRELASQDPAVADRAIFSLLRGYLGDSHSKYLSNSSYAGRDADTTGLVSPSVAGLQAAQTHMKELRAAQYPDSVPAYQEIGDTAYITFDSFTFYGQTYTADTLPAANDPRLDTQGLITYANEQIRRPGSPITKVVMDLSCNTGGDANAAAFAASWYLGEAPISVVYTTSGAEATTVYQADVNGNGVFGEAGDTVRDLDRYCLISEASFSSGNLVPAIFKNSEQVTVVGRQSHGGACSVGYLAAADGTLFRISTPIQLSWLYNGSYYDIDQGVEPDVPITVEQHYYDREYLANYLGALLR